MERVVFESGEGRVSLLKVMGSSYYIAEKPDGRYIHVRKTLNAAIAVLKAGTADSGDKKKCKGGRQEK